MGITKKVQKFKDFAESVQSVLDVMDIVSEIGDIERVHAMKTSSINALEAEIYKKQAELNDADAKVSEAKENAKSIINDADRKARAKINCSLEEVALTFAGLEKEKEEIAKECDKAILDAQETARKTIADANAKVSDILKDIDAKKKEEAEINELVKLANIQLKEITDKIDGAKEKLRAFMG